MTKYNTRRSAAEAGHFKYWTGRPCKRGHDTYRYVSTGMCEACNAGYRHKYTGLKTKRMITALQGLKTISFDIHPDDEKAIEEFVKAIKLARDLS